jgi:hypothetical protein
MTEHETRRRASFFMTQLARADAIAGLPARTSSPTTAGARPLVDAIRGFIGRFAPTEPWERYCSVFNAYAAAYRRAKRSPDDFAFDFIRKGEALWCTACSVDVTAATWAELLEHVSSVGHLARAEGREARRAS